MRTYTAYVVFDAESRTYIGMFPGLPGAQTYGETLDELDVNLKEVLELCLEEYEGSPSDLPQYVGIRQIVIN
ncbi:MAG: type II toxin-antitoxin system HicB family antitoxin [Anaerolinea sp.]|nr:type II toxin-antitoxin system HicB family antitoxin [Anaerolinea sp.]